ncbi:cell division protein FtsQ/DivIB [Xanthomonadaceae bacterium JHOS43]|nr:cell division protein FtsQ/DivIB [Xanthomonadaceae bacterium JHOS43]
MSGLIRIIAWFLALGVVALPLIAVLNGWMAPDRWPIRHLQVTAEYQRVSVEQIRTTVAAHTGRGYFDTDPAAIRTALAGLPWVDTVEVRKRWPDRLEVLLVEHRARAHWGEDRLLSAQGVLFITPGAADVQGLPRLSGPDDRVDEVVAFYENARQQLALVGLTLEGVSLTARGSWSLQLNGGASIVVGRSTTPQVRIARLVRVLPQLLEGERRPFARIDLRYTNGFAIAWQDPLPGAGVPVRRNADRTAFNHLSISDYST